MYFLCVLRLALWCEKIICCGELGITPSKKLANLGLNLHVRAGHSGIDNL